MLNMLAADIAKNAVSDADCDVKVYFGQMLSRLIEKVDESVGLLANGVVAPLFWTSHSVEAKRMNHTFKLLKATPLTNI